MNLQYNFLQKKKPTFLYGYVYRVLKGLEKCRLAQRPKQYFSGPGPPRPQYLAPCLYNAVTTAAVYRMMLLCDSIYTFYF